MEHIILINQQDSKTLLSAARQCIEHGITYGLPTEVKMQDYSATLQNKQSSFVTLHKHKQLRGCIGSLQAKMPLIADVVKNAFLAAFRDPRFQPVITSEIPEIDLDISVLSIPKPVSFTSEQDLLQLIRPGIDGLILHDQGHSGTFLPTVWEQIPDPQTFLAHLKQKAGLPPDYWSDTIKVERYTTQLLS